MSFPLLLDAGESVTFRLHLGFIPKDDVKAILKSIFAAEGPLHSHKTFLALAEKGMTIYGGKATMQKFDGGAFTVTFEPASLMQAPVYHLAFQTGRNQEFSTVNSPYPKPWQERANGCSQAAAFA